MKLKPGKRYETADGTVYKVREHMNIFDVSYDTDEHWDKDGYGFGEFPDLIRRHYKKLQPAHKLDLQPGDVVELVEWEDGSTDSRRPLFKVVSRSSATKA